MVETYDEIEEILLSIRDNVYANNVLISGSYDDDDPLADRISAVAEKLSFELIQKNYRIMTGFGKNLGADIVDGAYEGCTKANKEAKDFTGNVMLFPFPYRQRKRDYIKKVYSDIRRYMVSITKIMIIIAGTKNNQNAQGVYEEFTLAMANNNIVIPIATSGGSARQIWDELNKLDKYHNSPSFQKLNSEINPEAIVKSVFSLINEFRGE